MEMEAIELHGFSRGRNERKDYRGGNVVHTAEGRGGMQRHGP